MADLGDFIRALFQPVSPAEVTPEPRPGYGLGTATGISRAKSEMEPTLAPGEWEEMTTPERAGRAQDQLAGIVEAAGFMAAPLAGISSHAPELQRPARLRGRPGGSIGDLAAADPFYSQAEVAVSREMR